MKRRARTGIGHFREFAGFSNGNWYLSGSLESRVFPEQYRITLEMSWEHIDAVEHFL